MAVWLLRGNWRRVRKLMKSLDTGKQLRNWSTCQKPVNSQELVEIYETGQAFGNRTRYKEFARKYKDWLKFRKLVKTWKVVKGQENGLQHS
jgi:hypothetical protein